MEMIGGNRLDMFIQSLPRVSLVIYNSLLDFLMFLDLKSEMNGLN